MALLDRAHPANVDGDWYVDDRCINCDVSRQLAPGLFGETDDQAVVNHQPATPDEELAAWRAALACPTQSIGTRSRRRAPEGLFPQELADGVFYCGYTSTKSFAANAFFTRRAAGNVLVDSPRFTRALADPIEALGGVDHVLLTHRDDVADADRWAERFGARVWIHEADRSAAPYATDFVHGTDPVEIQPDLLAIPVPGHTRGSMLFLLEERFLFTGDSLAWSRGRGDLVIHEGFTWYSLAEQVRSLERVARDHQFEWVLPGHGDRHCAPSAEMHERLLALLSRVGR